MGASKWFFSLSGTILLIGALAIGGKGLNFGIDFKSRHAHPDGVHQAGQRGPRSREVMSSRRLRQRRRSRSSPTRASAARLPDLDEDARARTGEDRSRRALDTKFGNGPSDPGTKNFSSTSIGPTFGKTVANSAVIAIIASLLVISAYIALRFEWKYAVPGADRADARPADHGRRLLADRAGK